MEKTESPSAKDQTKRDIQILLPAGQAFPAQPNPHKTPVYTITKKNSEQYIVSWEDLESKTAFIYSMDSVSFRLMDKIHSFQGVYIYDICYVDPACTMIFVWGLGAGESCRICIVNDAGEMVRDCPVDWFGSSNGVAHLAEKSGKMGPQYIYALGSKGKELIRVDSTGRHEVLYSSNSLRMMSMALSRDGRYVFVVTIKNKVYRYCIENGQFGIYYDFNHISNDKTYQIVAVEDDHYIISCGPVNRQLLLFRDNRGLGIDEKKENNGEVSVLYKSKVQEEESEITFIKCIEIGGSKFVVGVGFSNPVYVHCIEVDKNWNVLSKNCEKLCGEKYAQGSLKKNFENGRSC